MKCRCNELIEIEGWEANEFAEVHLKIVQIKNWEIDYECPETGIHWLMDFPNGDWQGGGPPRLRKLPIA
jgi:hypothetical protein